VGNLILRWASGAFLAALLVLGGPGRLAPPAAGAKEVRSDEGPTNTLTDDERKAGWQLLFDGKTTKGWRKYKGKAMPDKWKVKGGVLTFKPKGGKEGGDIVTEKEYGDFELAIDWKISKGGNSGIMYRVVEGPPAPWLTGPEYQLCDNKRHPDGKNPKTSCASCYALYAPSEDATKPAGQWNNTRLVVRGNRVDHWLNGKKVVGYELGRADWNKRVKASKFKDFAKFGKASKGRICLQDHGDEVAFANIKIRVLKKNDKGGSDKGR
jgi:hypothetical protein